MVWKRYLSRELTVLHLLSREGEEVLGKSFALATAITGACVRAAIFQKRRVLLWKKLHLNTTEHPTPTYPNKGIFQRCVIFRRFQVFGSPSEIFVDHQLSSGIFVNFQLIFGNVRKPSGHLQKSLENCRSSENILT